MTDDILVDERDGIATVTLNRPQALNAMTPVLMGQLRDVVVELDARREVRVIVFTGAGRAFSAGGDRNFLDSLSRMSAVEIAETVYANFQGAVKAVKLCNKPTIAAVNGAAVGAGCELAVACDFRVVSADAKFIESWIHLGVIAPLGGMTLLPRLIGLGRATEMLMLGKAVGGQEAVDIGLASQCVPNEELEDAVRTLAQRLAASPPLALRVFKAGLRRAADSTLAAEWEAGLYAQSLLIGSNDFKEAVQASLEKRTPTFTGQ